MGMTAAIAGGAALLGTGAQIYGASTAAGTQRDAARQSQQTQMNMFDKTQANMKPFIDNGVSAGNQLFSMLPQLTKGFNPTMGDLEATPGYQFTKTQGMNAVNNSNSVKGWGNSGAGAKAIADYTTGLADNTYGNQFDRYWANNKNIFGMLFDPYQVGGQVAGNLGTIGQGTANSISGAQIGAGNATASAALGMGNAVATAPTNALMSYRMLDETMNPDKYGNLFGGGYGGWGYGTQYSRGL